MRKIYYVYIIKCSDHSYYTGITNNVYKRIEEHNIGIDRYSYTYSRRPVELLFYHDFLNVEDAIIFEKKIKGWSRAKKEALIEGRFDDLPKLSTNHHKDYSTSY